MKLKGLTKLALSGVALAAVAATLGTSTYAWYVSNSKAEVSNISGQSNTQAAGSLLINKLKSGAAVATDPQVWTNKIALNDQTALAFNEATALEPVTRDKDGYTAAQGKTATGWHDVAGLPVATNKAYGYFFIGLKTTDANKNKVNMALSIKNATDTTALPTQTAYVGADKGAPTGIQVTNKFTEDFIYSLKFDFHVDEIEEGKAPAYYLTEGKPNATDENKIDRYTAYNAESFKNYDNAAQGYQTLSGAKADGNAHTYYKSLSEDNTSTTNDVTSIIGGESDGGVDYSTDAQFTLDVTKEYVLVVRYWLDGADAQCFDSCISQKFQLKINLESVAA